MGKRDLILDSAEELLRTESASQLTLERVAGRAKVSKGGLLYHFPSKDQLVAGLIERTIADFNREMAAAKAALPDVPGRNALAFVTATLEGTWARQTSVDMIASTLAASSIDKKLVEPIRQAYLHWQSELEADGLDPIRATIIRLAVDGLWYTEMFGFDEFSAQRRTAVLSALRKLCIGGTAIADLSPNRKPRKAKG